MGVDAFAARLVGPAFATACVAMTGLLVLRLGLDRPARGGAAALILAVSPVWLLFGSTTMFDAMLTAATLLAMFALWSAVRRPRRAAWVALGMAVAPGRLCQGAGDPDPHAARGAVDAVVGRAGPPVGATMGGLALAVALVAVGLWLVPALILGGPEYRIEVPWRQSGGRMVASFAHRKPWWFYAALLPAMIWPFGWTGAGLGALRPRRLWADPGTRLAADWAMRAFVAFSLISGKQAHDLLPELPALALLLSDGQPARRWVRRGSVAQIVC